MTYRIGWSSSGEVHSEEGRRSSRELLQAVMKAKEVGTLDVEISFVFSNIERGERPYGDEFFKLVDSYGIPLVTRSSARFKPEMREEGKREYVALNSDEKYDKPSPILNRWRDSYDNYCLEYLRNYERPKLCVLAGDMTIWGRPRCEYSDAINLHPAKPGGPKGTWQDVIWEIIRQREREHGVMMHLVTPELDKGPPVTYCRFPVVGGEYNLYWQQLDEQLKTKAIEQIIEEEKETNPLHRLMRRDGFRRELPLIVETIRLFSKRVVEFRDKVLYDAGANTPLRNGYDLTTMIESCLRGNGLEK